MAAAAATRSGYVGCDANSDGDRDCYGHRHGNSYTNTDAGAGLAADQSQVAGIRHGEGR